MWAHCWCIVAEACSFVSSVGKGCCFLFHSTSPWVRVCPCRNQEQPCVLPDATQAHQIFIFHQTLCTRNRKHVQISKWTVSFLRVGPNVTFRYLAKRARRRISTLVEAFGVNKTAFCRRLLGDMLDVWSHGICIRHLQHTVRTGLNTRGLKVLSTASRAAVTDCSWLAKAQKCTSLS